MSIIGCYSLYLYCCCESCSRHGGSMRKHENGFLEIVGAHTARASLREARRKGWRIDQVGDRAWAPGHKARLATDKSAFPAC